MYRVKLAVKSIDEITVDGITITHKWKRIEEKTKFLEELEKEGKIIIEEVKDEEQTKHSYLNVHAELAEILDGSKTRERLAEIAGMIDGSKTRERLAEIMPIIDGSKFRERQAEIMSIIDGSKFRDAQLRIGTMLSDALMEARKVDKPHTEPKAKKEQNKVEQKPISTEQNELNQKINDIEKRIEDIYNIKEDDYKYKSLREKVEKIFVRIDALENRADKNENTRDIKPDAIKKADIKKIAWMKSRKQLFFIIQQLCDEGFLLIAESVDDLITDHFETKEGQSSRKDAEIKKIRWIGTQAQIVFFIDKLFEIVLLSEPETIKKDELIINHFENKKGKPFTRKGLPAARFQISFNTPPLPRRGKKILEILEKTKKLEQ